MTRATSKQDIHLMHGAGIMHCDAVTRQKTNVLDLSGTNNQVSTIIAKEDPIIAGGFYGAVALKNLYHGTWICHYNPYQIPLKYIRKYLHMHKYHHLAPFGC